MDLTMVAGGLLVSVAAALTPQQVELMIAVLDQLAERPTMSPGERHIFQVLSDTLHGKDGAVARISDPRPRFEVIAGGAA